MIDDLTGSAIAHRTLAVDPCPVQLLRHVLPSLLAVACSGVLAAQDSVPAAPGPDQVRALRITRDNIFTAGEATSFLPRLVNRFHVTTRESVIKRELLVAPGEPLDSLSLAESARNLRRLGVFRSVAIDTVRHADGVDVHIQTRDGWSTKPEFGLRSTGGQAAWRATLTEENLLGTASRVALGYSSDPDRTAFVLLFRQPRLVAGRIGLGLFLEDRSDGTILTGVVSQPFHTLRDRVAWSVSYDTRDQRILRYFEGEPFPRDTLQRAFDAVGGAVAWAANVGPRVYYRAGLSARLWRDDYTPAGQEVPTEAVTRGTVGVNWEWRRARYLVVRGLSGAKEQDVDVSTTLWAGLYATPTAFGWQENGVGALVSLRYGGVLTPNAFGYVDLNAGGRFTSAGVDSGSVQVSGTAVWSPAEHHVATLHAWGGWLDGPRPGGEFDLGLGLGPRGFRLHAFTGDQGYFGTAEYRFMVLHDWLRVLDLGIAGFVDHGGAWYHGASRRTGWSGGLGLRLGPSRSTDIDLTRLDLVRRGRTDAQPPGWVLVIGRGLTFSLSGLIPR